MFDYGYIAIDLKSFYASVECMSRGLDPLSTNLVVADASRTEKTICLAVSPSLKAYGVPGRARLFEVVQRVREVNADRLQVLRRTANRGDAKAQRGKPSDSAPANSKNAAGAHKPQGKNRSEATCDPWAEQCETPAMFSYDQGANPFEADCTGRSLEAYSPFEQALFTGSSFDDNEVRSNPALELDYLIAKPRMAQYIEVSTQIYKVYLKYFAPEDIHVYSIDEVFIDASKYAHVHKMDTKTLASRVVADVYRTTGITATAGIGTNLFLAKVAMDVLAKHEMPDENGVRIALLNEQEYKRRIWPHKPITDIWRVGKGYARRLEQNGMFTMGDVARCSLGGRADKLNEDTLYRLFGKNAELLIDHAWGYEPVTMQEIKNYRPAVNCKASGQVLQCPYSSEKARLVVWEMADQLAFDLLAENLETDKLTLTVGYDRSNLDEGAGFLPSSMLAADAYGRTVPKHAHGTANLSDYTASSQVITNAVLNLYDSIINPQLLVRRINLSAERVLTEQEAAQKRTESNAQLALFEFEEPKDQPREENSPGAASGSATNRSNTPAQGATARTRGSAAQVIDGEAQRSNAAPSEAELEKERCLHNTMLNVREKFGKNAVLRAANLQEGATAQQRNRQIGGHNA